MKIYHFANWGPRVSGMYESTKDQIKYERAAGHESFFIDAMVEEIKDSHVDGWLSPSPWDQAMDGDIWVMHSKIPGRLRTKKPDRIKTVAIIHGPTEHMLLKGWQMNEDLFNLHISILWTYDATIAINEHEYDILSHYDEKKNRLHYIPNSIDLGRVKNVPVLEYQNHPAIGSFDTPRLEKMPFHIIFAVYELIKKVPTARLNFFSMLLEKVKFYRSIFCRSHERHLEGICENTQLANQNLLPHMAGIDIGFNNNYSGICSRVSMEMMALGVPVVSYRGDYTKYHAEIFNIQSIADQLERCWNDLQAPGSTLREETKQYAKDNFDRKKHVATYIKMYEKLLGG